MATLAAHLRVLHGVDLEPVPDIDRETLDALESIHDHAHQHHHRHRGNDDRVSTLATGTQTATGAPRACHGTQDTPASGDHTLATAVAVRG